MPGTAVFVSSRMDELAFERRSAFDAVYLNGLTPLLFETEPTGRNEKLMIDNLVDRAGIFVGIYYQTLGFPQEALGDLEPIAYELYRFLFRFTDPIVEIETDFRNYCNSTVRERLDELLLPPERRGADNPNIRQLRQEIEDGRHEDLLARRVRFYVKTHAYDTAMSVNLARMLRVFPKVEAFLSRQDELPNAMNAAGESLTRYVTARFDLFDRIHDDVTYAIQNKGLKLSDSPIQPHSRHHWRIVSPDLPGVLFRALEVLFAEAFNIDLICCGKPLKDHPESADQVVIDIVAHPFLPTSPRTRRRSPKRTNADSERQVRRIERKLRRALPLPEESRVKIRHRALETWETWSHVPRAREQEPGDSSFYRIETADVPGQILRLTEKVFHYGGSVDLLYFDGRSSRLRRLSGRDVRFTEKMLAISPSPDQPDAPIKEPIHRSRFEAELRQSLGVVGVRELSHERFYSRLDAIVKETERRVGAAVEDG